MGLFLFHILFDEILHNDMCQNFHNVSKYWDGNNSNLLKNLNNLMFKPPSERFGGYSDEPGGHLSVHPNMCP